MAIKTETAFQSRIQTLIRKNGGYVPKKNHGNMITVIGLHDLPFTYKGFSMYWEIKTPETSKNVSVEQGIHCRLARRAGAFTAIISTVEQAKMILNHLDFCVQKDYSPATTKMELDAFYKKWGLDDGTSY